MKGFYLARKREPAAICGIVKRLLPEMISSVCRKRFFEWSVSNIDLRIEARNVRLFEDTAALDSIVAQIAFWSDFFSKRPLARKKCILSQIENTKCEHATHVA